MRGFILFFVLLLTWDSRGGGHALLSGWYPWAPYQYVEKGKDGVIVLTGLDAELVRAISKEAGQEISYDEQVAWSQHRRDLISGKRAMAAGVTASSDLKGYVNYSLPYRFESNAFYALKKPLRAQSIHFHSPQQFIDDIKKQRFRLGVVDGFVYVSPLMNAFIHDPKNSDYIVRSGSEEENIQKLMDGKIDGFLADRLSGATLIWKMGFTRDIRVEELGERVPVHLAFSKKAVSAALVKNYNVAIERLQKSGANDAIYRQYLYPLIMQQALDSDWFFVLEIIGTIAFAISGLIVAYKDDATFFGAIVFALLPSTGGGMLRDALVGREPVGLLLSPLYLYIVLVIVLIGYTAIKIAQKNKHIYTEKIKKNLGLFLVISDAIGLAAFTVVGVMVAMLVKVSPLWLWGPFLAFLTGAGGGILRDLLRKGSKVEGLHGDIYPEIAILWGGILSCYFMFVGAAITLDMMFYSVLGASIGTFITRLIVAHYKIPNLRFR